MPSVLRTLNKKYFHLNDMAEDLRLKIANGECVSPLTADRCPVCIDCCEASRCKNEFNELLKETGIEP